MESFSIWQIVIFAAVGFVLLTSLGSRRGNTEAYVIKEWTARDTPDKDGIYIRITGRKGGFISFVMSLVGIDPTVSLVVDHENVRFKRGSWTGYSAWVTPLNKLCSGQYGYSKPFWSVFFVVAVGILLLIPTRGISLLLILGGIAYYFLNKTLVIGLTFVGGGNIYSGDALAFKRSVIEGQDINELAAERIVAIIEMIVLGADTPRPSIGADSPRPSASETLNRAANDLVNTAERARQKAEAFSGQASEMGERAAAKISSLVANTNASNTSSTGHPRFRGSCPKCQRPVLDTDVFCGECGTQVA